MNGETFVKNFKLIAEIEEDSIHMGELGYGRISGAPGVDTILSKLYLFNEVEQLTQVDPPEVIELALRERQELNSNMRKSSNVFKEAHRLELLKKGIREDRDRRTAPVPNPSDLLPIIDLEHIVSEDIVNLHSDEADFMLNLLAQTLSAIRQGHNKNPQANASDAISGSIRTLRRSLTQRLESWDLVLEVNRTYIGRNQLYLNVNTITSSSKSAPRWYKSISEWVDPLHYVTSALSELDAFVALEEWVIARKLTYLPIMAPPAVESGPQLNGTAESNNLHADILLCSMVKNDLIPIQLKNSFNSISFLAYHPDMQFILPRNLGGVSVQSTIVKPKEIAYLGREGTTTYGDIFNLWMSTYKSKPNSRQVNALQARLAEPFRFFDETILPKIAA